ncbi:MAG: hypothetical protein QNJ92_12705 [Alphaproteobacteria bacterium]|nr:hypothetical protein [Alphaproteobacteria bacterium]
MVAEDNNHPVADETRALFAELLDALVGDRGAGDPVQDDEGHLANEERNGAAVQWEAQSTPDREPAETPQSEPIGVAEEFATQALNARHPMAVGKFSVLAALAGSGQLTPASSEHVDAALSFARRARRIRRLRCAAGGLARLLADPAALMKLAQESDDRLAAAAFDLLAELGSDETAARQLTQAAIERLRKRTSGEVTSQPSPSSEISGKDQSDGSIY